VRRRGGALIVAGVVVWLLALLMTAIGVRPGRYIVLADVVSVILYAAGIFLIFRGNKET
jgi:hypothetical protein